MGEHIYVDTDESEMYGSFDTVYCKSKDNGYEVIGKITQNGSEKIYFFESNRLKYYGELKENIASGKITEGMTIDANPIYIFVNSEPADGKETRIEIDFS